ncbi:hypothetical protein B1B04_20380 [Lysinibacillus sp. KCTC 33748]|uniref:hypothetical protein n=1 Tax=unclassified Lysinibacillus TaxID=2636778 RepID=UPI0009A7C3E8|nr:MULTISPECIES: hypothetical protein [unclassified Lysinibacillus]OXS68488.1 hypothetical protein B1B04_20380 [Lysinibacillus sp. KCTC 33748]SKC10159.1 hypothetical protein SAMN06295926_1236 [Lysinibacillus sp. AC-3]
MRNFISGSLFIIFTLLLTGCVGVEKENEKSISNTKLTIEPYKMSEKEELLISKTGVEQIAFFKLEGNLKEDDDLQFTVEVYENGKLKEESLSTSNEPQTKFEDCIVSFGINNINDKDHSLQLISGIPSGFATTNYSNNMTSSSFSKLVSEKVTLEKNKPIYLAAWVGTTKDKLRFVGSENGELPAGIEEAEFALLYRILWTNNVKK